MERMIEIKNVSFSYDEAAGKKALDDFSLTVRRGEFLGVAGHNGSGKSTLAKLINGLLIPTQGDVLVLSMNTKDEDKLIDIRRNMGMVFQNPDNQMVATIVEEDVAFGAENLGIEPQKIRELVDESLRTVDMYEYRNKKPHQLSGGQKQRVAIAGVLAMHPKCIIFDESTAMLDPAGRAEVMRAMMRLNKEDGVTIVLITHYMDELVGADRIVIMQNGQLALEGTPREVFARADQIKQLSLDVPEIAEIAALLRDGGLNIEDGVLTAQELVDAICRLK